MAEYYDHLKSHPAALAAATPAHAATNGASPSPRGSLSYIFAHFRAVISCDSAPMPMP